MRKLTALSLALLLALSAAIPGTLAMEQIFLSDRIEEDPSVVLPGEDSPVLPEELEEEDSPVLPEEPEEEDSPVLPEEPEEVDSPVPPEEPKEETPAPTVWTEVSTIDELCAAGGSAAHIRLTADLTVSGPQQFYTFWTPTVLDTGDFHIRVEADGCFVFGGGAQPVVLLGDGSAEDLFQISSGGELHLGDVDASEYSGVLARQEEGGWLVVKNVSAQPEQIVYAKAPVVCERVAGFAAVPQGLAPEELMEQLPDAKVFINYQGRYEQAVIPREQLFWDLEEQWEDIAAGRRTVLHARPAGPLTGEEWFESELTATVLAPLSCELAILVDGAAIGEIIDHHDIYGSSYEMCIILPDRVEPEGLPFSQERGPACLEFSLDGGKFWLSIKAGEEGLYKNPDLPEHLMYASVTENRGEEPWETRASLGILSGAQSLVRVWADYQGEGYIFRLYTDTLLLTSEGSYIHPGAGGSRGGTIELLPDLPVPPVEEPDPPGPVPPPVEEPDPPGPVPPPVEEPDPPGPVLPPVEEPDPPGLIPSPVEEPDPPGPVPPPVEEPDPPGLIPPPVEEPDPPGPVSPPMEEPDPPGPIPPSVEEPDSPGPVPPAVEEPGSVEKPSLPSPVESPAQGEKNSGISRLPLEAAEKTKDAPAPAPQVPVPAQTASPAGETRQAADTPVLEDPPAPAPGLPAPVVQVMAGTAITVGLITAAVAVKPAAVLNWLRRLLHRL